MTDDLFESAKSNVSHSKAQLPKSPSEGVTWADLLNLEQSACGAAKHDLALHQLVTDGAQLAAKVAGIGTGAHFGAQVGAPGGLPGIAAGAVVGGTVGYIAGKVAASAVIEIADGPEKDKQLRSVVDNACRRRSRW
jgi:hypothetical protein